MKKLLWWVHGSERLPESREGVEPFRTPERETWLGRVGLPSLAVLGLLCHLLIFWSLSWTYAYLYLWEAETPVYQVPGSPSEYFNATITGWTVMKEQPFLLLFVTFPILPYLACLLLMLRKSEWMQQRLKESLYLNGLLNLVGFFFTWWFLLYYSETDLYDRSWLDGTRLMMLLLFFAGSSVCSVLLGSLLRRSRKLRCGQSLRIENTSTPDQVVWHDRYQVGALLGSGGFSAVYRARDRQEGGRDVAIKRISLQGLNAEETIEATDTFHREVSMLSALNHPQVPRLYDHFNDQDHWYLVLEYIEGQTLEAFLTTHETSGQPLQLAEILTMVLQLCTVLDYLHRRQPPIIFRDLKPSNILRTFGGKLYLIDFGIARRYQPGQPRDTQRLGSPGYAAPEQYGRAQTTPQADIYSLGALLHFLLSGQDPANSPLGLTPLRLHSQQGLAELELLVAQMLSPNPTERPASVRAVAKTLDRIKQQVGTDDARRIWVPPPSQPLLPSDGSHLHSQLPHSAGLARPPSAPFVS